MTPPPIIVEQLRDLEQSLLDPLVRRSRESVGRVLANDFVEFGTSGNVYDKTAVLEAMANESPTVVSLSNFEARGLALDVFLATFKTTHLDASGQLVSQSLRSSLWRRIDGQWQLLFHQGTRVPPE